MAYISRTNNATFRTGEKIEKSGWYICVPCGYKKRLKEGEKFPSCLSCLDGHEDEFQKGFELWEEIV